MKICLVAKVAFMARDVAATVDVAQLFYHSIYLTYDLKNLARFSETAENSHCEYCFKITYVLHDRDARFASDVIQKCAYIIVLCMKNFIDNRKFHCMRSIYSPWHTPEPIDLTRFTQIVLHPSLR